MGLSTCMCLIILTVYHMHTPHAHTTCTHTHMHTSHAHITHAHTTCTHHTCTHHTSHMHTPHTHMHTCTHHTCTYTCTHHMHTPHAHITHAHTHAHIHTCTHTHMHTCTHTHMHIYSQLPAFNEFARSQLSQLLYTVPLPEEGSLFDYCLDLTTYQFIAWTARNVGKKSSSGQYATLPEVSVHTPN